MRLDGKNIVLERGDTLTIEVTAPRGDVVIEEVEIRARGRVVITAYDKGVELFSRTVKEKR